MYSKEIKIQLESALSGLDAKNFIAHDPISIPHGFSSKTDIEISAFLTSVLSWGKRESIIKSASRLIQLMHNDPTNFIMHANKKDKDELSKFKHRTLNGDDIIWLVNGLQRLYTKYGDMESAFNTKGTLIEGISHVRETLLEINHDKRSEKHLGNPEKNSACKRFFMFLRWMIRFDKNGIDFGIWNSFSSSELIIPLDVHIGNSARRLGITKRKANDLKTAFEITEFLQKLDPQDPIKYDFALFNLDIK